MHALETNLRNGEGNVFPVPKDSDMSSFTRRVAEPAWGRVAASAVAVGLLGAPAAANSDEAEIIRHVAALEAASVAERAAILEELAPHGDAAVDVVLEFMQEELLARDVALQAVAELQSGAAAAASPEAGAPSTPDESEAKATRPALDAAPDEPAQDDAFLRPEQVHPPAEAPRHRIVNVDDDDKLNIRDRPGVSGSTINGRIAPDAVNVATGDVTAEASDGGTWVEVLYGGLPGGSGWVNAHFLEEIPEGESRGLGAPDIEPGAPNDLADYFIGLEGYEELDWETVERRFLEAAAGDDVEAFRAINNLGPLTRALLILEEEEDRQVHARYRIRYGMEDMGPFEPKAYTTPISFVQIDRFNMGPQKMEALPQENPAPHVSYRMVMDTIQMRKARAFRLSRTEIDDDTAAAMSCLGVSCLSMESPADQAPGAWEADPEAEITITPPYDLMAPDATHSPAAVLDQLTIAHGFLGDEHNGNVSWSYPEPREGVTFGAPFIEIVIDVNLAQEFAVQGVLRDAHLNDTSVAALWHKVSSMASGDPDSPVVSKSSQRERRPPSP